jgi:hypothetical protein
VTIAFASSPYPLGLLGLLDRLKRARSVATPTHIGTGAELLLQGGGPATKAQSNPAASPASPAAAGAVDVSTPPACCVANPVLTRLLEVAHCWNIQRNYKALLKPDPGIPGMAVLNGMRVVAIMAIVLGHTFAFMQMHITNRSFAGVVAERMSVIGIIGNQHVMDNGTSVAYLSVDTCPRRPGAVKRPSRFPIKIHFVWDFCMGAQGA